MTTSERLSGLVIIMSSFLRNLLIEEKHSFFITKSWASILLSQRMYARSARRAFSEPRCSLMAAVWCFSWAHSNSNSAKVYSLHTDLGGKPKFSPCESTNRSKSDSLYCERFTICFSVSLNALPKRLLLSDAR